MKPLFLFLIALLGATFAKAQLQWGFKAGLNLSNIHASGTSDGTGSNSSFHLKPGLNAGALLNITLANQFSLQPELLYSMEGSNVTSSYEKVVDRLNFINLPVLLQYKIGAHFFAEIGPQASFLATAKKKVNSTATLIFEDPNDPAIDRPGQITDIKSYYNTFILSGAIGVGYHINQNIGAGIRFTHGLTNLTKQDEVGNNQKPYNYRNYSFQLSFFYLLGNTRK